MIHAAISIRVRGQVYRYVRDVVNDTAGVNERYYAYRGNARRKINLTENNLTSSKKTGLKSQTNYDFKVSVNDNSEETYTISFSPKDPLQPITYFDLIKKLNSVSKDFRVIFDDTDRSTEGIYFIAEGNESGTSIDVSSGDSNDLFTHLNHFDSIEDELPSDNFFDQTGDGKIYGDFISLKNAMEDDTEYFLLFPESGGDTSELVRENRESKGSLIINSITRSIVENLHIVEYIQSGRDGHVG